MKYIYWTLLLFAFTVTITIVQWDYVPYGFMIASAAGFLYTIFYNFRSGKSDQLGTDESRILLSIILPIVSAILVIIPAYINLDTIGFNKLH
jgi:hypothetical protein